MGVLIEERECMDNPMNEGMHAYELAQRLFPIYRSITGEGVRKTLGIIKDFIGDNSLRLYEVKSGEKAFDWIVPKEWTVRDAFIEGENGKKYAEFKKNCLHLVGYSAPVDRWMDLDELNEYIYTQKDQPDAIPYVTSYYEQRFGFCMSEKQKNELRPGKYRVYVDSDLFDGSLTYADAVFPGKTKKEILISTYTCHPSMANDNCSGLVLSAELAKHVSGMKDRYYTYRFVFCPETIGAIVYLSQNGRKDYLKKYAIGGFCFSCVGDDGDYSVIASKEGNSVCDKVLKSVLDYSEETKDKTKFYSFLQRGSDERQYNSPGVDIPVVGFCRTKYWEYPEYHTSLDTLAIISPAGLQGSFDVMKKTIDVLECNRKYRMTVPCEPQLSKRGLYPSVSQKNIYDQVQTMMDFVAYADGRSDLVQMAERINRSVYELVPIARNMSDNGLVVVEDDNNESCGC